MITENQIVNNVRNLLRLKNDDNKITNSQLLFIFNNWRARLIVQNYRKARFSDFNLSQDLGCIPMEVVDSAEWCDIESGCKLLKTVNRLPITIEIDEKPLFTFIGSIQKTGSAYQLISWARMGTIKNQRYASKQKYVALKDGYLYMLNNTVLDSINVQGIFEDPREAGSFTHCSGEPCYTADMRYPVDASTVPLITELMFTKELAAYKMTQQDATNDNNDDTRKA